MLAHRLAGGFRIVPLDGLEDAFMAGETYAVFELGVGHVDALVDQPLHQRLVCGEEDRIAGDRGQHAVKGDFGDGEGAGACDGAFVFGQCGGKRIDLRLRRHLGGMACDRDFEEQPLAVADAEERMRAVLARPAIKQWLA
jgi:hypothetical protein